MIRGSGRLSDAYGEYSPLRFDEHRHTGINKVDLRGPAFQHLACEHAGKTSATRDVQHGVLGLYLGASDEALVSVEPRNVLTVLMSHLFSIVIGRQQIVVRRIVGYAVDGLAWEVRHVGVFGCFVWVGGG
jgi:hypothetical protein